MTYILTQPLLYSMRINWLKINILLVSDRQSKIKTTKFSIMIVNYGATPAVKSTGMQTSALDTTHPHHSPQI